MNRFQAFAIHLLTSAIVGLALAMLMFTFVYPWALSEATGVVKIFAMLMSIDVVLGPCLTLLIFNVAKKELKRDLMVIVLLQISAMCYGLHALYVARPVYQVFNTDRFDLVYANDLSASKLSAARYPEFKVLPWFGVSTIAAQRPTDSKSRNDVLFSALSGGDDLPQLPQYYVPYEKEVSQVVKRIQPLKDLFAYNPGQKEEVEKLIKKYQSQGFPVGFLPLKGRQNDLTVIINGENGTLLETLNLNPWK